MRIFYILISFILLNVTQAKSQAKSPFADGDNKIVRFYPNPAVTSITFDIEKDASQAHSLQIFNFLGKKVFEIPVSAKTVVDLSSFIRGIYIFQLKDQNGRVAESGKFQVAK